MSWKEWAVGNIEAGNIPGAQQITITCDDGSQVAVPIANIAYTAYGFREGDARLPDAGPTPENVSAPVRYANKLRF